MERCETNSKGFDHDETLGMLDVVADGSIAGLAIYNLLKMQLLSIRSLPERRPEDRVPRAC
jgi:hypothetical protein